MEKTDKEVVAILTLNKIDYTILKVKEGYVVVDENAEIKGGDYRFNGVHVVIHNPDMSSKGSVKIIASTFPLEGVKRFEMVDEVEIESQKHAKKEWPLWTYSKQFEACKNDFKSGYKTAQSKGLFNEEQMYLLAAYVTDFIAGRKGDFMITTPKDVADKFIQTLLPRYEVEMEEYKHNSCVNKCASYPSECLCKMEGIKPLTYEKDGVTYLKFKNH